MVSIAGAVQALKLAVIDLLPPPLDPRLAPVVMVNPVKSHPAGIGGYVGLNQSPVGEIHACNLKAQVVIRIKADNLVDLSDTESTVTNSLVSTDTALLRSQGIFQISRDTDFSQFYKGASDGLDAKIGKDIRFDINFEYQKPPETPSGLIDTLNLDLLLHTTNNPAKELYGDDFTNDPLAYFNILDDSPVNNGPSNWSYNAGAGQVTQSSNISGGSNAFNPNKRGSYLVLQPSRVPLLPENWLLHADLGANSGGIGVVFNFQNIDNFYFFIMSLPTPYRLLGKKVAGTFSFFDSGGQDNGNAYTTGNYSLRLIQQNGEFEVALDQTLIMNAHEDVLPASGSVGFFSRNSASARFQSLRWLAL
ncbi:MAG: hypothetical protein D3925_16345 [Candidatus Electrothrix sp. AR5]|nr:hypothetical protein [Candidatus Electrothrix sp. AR5]